MIRMLDAKIQQKSPWCASQIEIVRKVAARFTNTIANHSAYNEMKAESACRNIYSVFPVFTESNTQNFISVFPDTFT